MNLRSSDEKKKNKNHNESIPQPRPSGNEIPQSISVPATPADRRVSHNRNRVRDFNINTIMQISRITSLDDALIVPQSRFLNSQLSNSTWFSSTPHYNFQPYNHSHQRVSCCSANARPPTYHTRQFERSRTSIIKANSPCQIVNGRRRSRPTFDTSKVDELERAFRQSRYIYGTERSRIAKITGLTEKQVKIWFQNRRSKQKKQGKK
ncbi:Homeobox protein Nkx-6.1 [Thelohanellus kitauei]|uniref:Homeobox protein Nkx-6.1 n=1 Tax=Thelohanellus kitauei TaxID=669202 RepID=A0A0C2IVN7_THEKT|nr:Homeobox protein Nkx-6.1 [Thelohanellus kitauei]